MRFVWLSHLGLFWLTVCSLLPAEYLAGFSKVPLSHLSLFKPRFARLQIPWLHSDLLDQHHRLVALLLPAAHSQRAAALHYWFEYILSAPQRFRLHRLFPRDYRTLLFAADPCPIRGARPGQPGAPDPQQRCCIRSAWGGVDGGGIEHVFPEDLGL